MVRIVSKFPMRAVVLLPSVVLLVVAVLSSAVVAPVILPETLVVMLEGAFVIFPGDGACVARPALGLDGARV